MIPSERLKELLKMRGMSVEDFGKALHKTQGAPTSAQALVGGDILQIKEAQRLLDDGRIRIKDAQKLATVFGVDAAFWLEEEHKYRTEVARRNGVLAERQRWLFGAWVLILVCLVIYTTP